MIQNRNYVEANRQLHRRAQLKANANPGTVWAVNMQNTSDWKLSGCSWLDFWKSEAGINRSWTMCANRDCAAISSSIVGGHVQISSMEFNEYGYIIPICSSCNIWSNNQAFHIIDITIATVTQAKLLEYKPIITNTSIVHTDNKVNIPNISKETNISTPNLIDEIPLDGLKPISRKYTHGAYNEAANNDKYDLFIADCYLPAKSSSYILTGQIHIDYMIWSNERGFTIDSMDMAYINDVLRYRFHIKRGRNYKYYGMKSRNSPFPNDNNINLNIGTQQ